MPLKNSALKAIKNQRGSALGMAMVAGVVLIIGLLAIGEFMNNIYSEELTNYYKKRFGLLRNTMMGYIRSDQAWSRTTTAPVNISANFDCLLTKSCSSTEKPFSLFNAQGVRLSDPSNPKFGVDINGKPCSNFDVAEPDEQCVVRFEFTWVVDCSSCVHQAPRVLGKVFLAVKNKKVVVNTLSYGIDFARGKELGTVGETCKSLKGVYDTVTGQCQLPFADVPCKVGSSMNGTLSEGEINCEDSPGYGLRECPSGTKPVGINGKGELQCL